MRDSFESMSERGWRRPDEINMLMEEEVMDPLEEQMLEDPYFMLE